MAEHTDMILDGLLDEQTGEYIGDRNKQRYGEEAPGFPISYYHRQRLCKPTLAPKCPHCGKVVADGEEPLRQHIKAKHGGG